MNKNLILLTILLIVLIWWWYRMYQKTSPTLTSGLVSRSTNHPGQINNLIPGLNRSKNYNPADYLYGWENYPRGPPWAFGDRRPYAAEKKVLGGHFGGGVFSNRDPILESKLGGVDFRQF
jgi:hypothetical protein